MRERARRLLGDIEDESLRGEELALLLAGGRSDLLGVGDAALGGRCGSDLEVEWSAAEEAPDLRNGLGVVEDTDLAFNVVRDVDAMADGVETEGLFGDPLLNDAL